MLKVLSLFDASGKIRNEFRKHGHSAISLDIHSGYGDAKTDIISNILDFDYLAYKPNHFNFLFIALPCQTYSIASGAFHFKNNIPVTSTAITAINILIKVYQLTKHFNCDFIIENPSGGLINNVFFKSFFKLELTRVTLGSFGFKTQKKTDLLHNFALLFMNNHQVRCNGNYQKNILSNLSYRQRVQYPDAFVESLVQSIHNYYEATPQ